MTTRPIGAPARRMWRHWSTRGFRFGNGFGNGMACTRDTGGTSRGCDDRRGQPAGGPGGRGRDRPDRRARDAGGRARVAGDRVRQLPARPRAVARLPRRDDRRARERRVLAEPVGPPRGPDTAGEAARGVRPSARQPQSRHRPRRGRRRPDRDDGRNWSRFTVLFLLDAATFLSFFVAALAFVPEPVLPKEDGGTAPGPAATRTSCATGPSSAWSSSTCSLSRPATRSPAAAGLRQERGGRDGDRHRAHLPRQHARDRSGAVPALEGARGMAADGVARGHVRPVGRRVDHRLRRRPPAGDRGGCSRLRAGGDPLRAGGVLPGPGAGRARGRPRSPAPPRPPHGGVDHLVDIGFIVGPAVGGFVLQAEPLALWPLAAAVCLIAGAGASP